MIIKFFSKLFYRLEVNWLSANQDFNKIRLVILLNHTSLYEPLLVAAAPNWFVWRIARKMTIPIADKTLNRPIVGKFWKVLIPGLVSITRKRDKSWFEFIEAIENKSVIVIAPEGRMKRANGLDAHGKPMSVKSGIGDILAEINEGNMLMAYSGGLHHVQYPGQILPKIFKTIKLNLEMVDIPSYKTQFPEDPINFKRQIIADLEQRLKDKCPN